MILFFLSSGLFLGWSLGANDAANVFGSAVGTKMVSFTRAAIVASVFVILGAVIQGAGASHTLGALGSVSAIGGSFTVALSAAITVFWMTRLTIPVSTSQAIVGAIIGWNFYTGNTTNFTVLTKILSTWIMGPILGAIFAIILYYFISIFFRFLKNHLLQEDAYIRMGLLVVGAFSSFSLGANNIANVMGVFMSAAPENSLNLGLFSLSGIQQLFLLGGVAISVGIFTYSKRVMETVGNGLMQLSSKSAIITVLSHSLVLFIFSSQNLSDFVQSIGLPAIPLVPVSSSQVIIGAILGLGILKGGYNIKFKVMGGIAAGWVATPILAGVFSFFALFFVNNVFLIEVQQQEESVEIQVPHEDIDENKTTRVFDLKDKIEDLKDTVLPEIHETESPGAIQDSVIIEKVPATIEEPKEVKETNYSLYFYLALFILFLAAFIYFVYRWLRNSLKKNRILLNKNQQILKAQKDLAEIETKYHLLETQQMEDRLQYKNKELTTMALNLIEKNSFLDLLKGKIEELKLDNQDSQMTKKLNDLYLLISQNQNLENDREAFQIHVDDINRDFFYKLNQVYPNMTKNEKRLCVYLRLDMSSKEISSLFNISPKSVEMSRYRLRKKMNLGHNEHLSQVLKKL